MKTAFDYDPREWGTAGWVGRDANGKPRLYWQLVTPDGEKVAELSSENGDILRLIVNAMYLGAKEAILREALEITMNGSYLTEAEYERVRKLMFEPRNPN